MAETVLEQAAVEPSPVDLNAVRAEATSQERSRIAGILNHAEAEGRATLANTLALTTDMSVEDAARVLAASPKQQAAAGFAAAMADVKNPAVGPDAEGEGQSEASLIQAIVGKKEVK